MSQEPNVTVEHKQVVERPLHTTLTRGANGVYRWEISYHGAQSGECLKVLKEADAMLRICFGGAVEEDGDGH